MAQALDDLNPPQQEAVLHEGGALLVLAGAGSGKTRVITRRIAHLVQVKNVPAWRILAVTFTNKAAREMKERLEALLGPSAHALTVSTFHSAAAMILRREAVNAGLSKSFVIYDDSDQLQVVKRAIREVGVDVSSVSPRDMLSRIEAEKNAGRLPDQMDPGHDVRAQLTHKVYRTYQRLLGAANAVDFGDLLLLLVELLRTNEEVRLHYQRRFTHVLVDEFQDTNPVQYELLKLLAPPPRSNLVVVGDDDQSIYRWRGADVDNILTFPDAYQGCKVVKLEQNYRSDQTILEAAHAVIVRNRRRMQKKLWSARAKGEPLSLVIARDERGEAQEVARMCHQLRTEGVCDYEEMAVFFRTNAQSRVLEETFRLSRVPYVLVSGRSFYDRHEIRDASSYLRLMINPKSDADLLRVINTPARGIGDTTEERVQEYASERGLSLFEALEAPERITSLGSAATKRLIAFKALLDRLVAFATTAPDATSAAQYMLQETGMVSSYMAEGSDEALGRAENLKELLTATQEFDKQRAGTAAAAGTPLAVPAAPLASPEPLPTVDEVLDRSAEVEADEPPPAQGDLFGGPARGARDAAASTSPRTARGKGDGAKAPGEGPASPAEGPAPGLASAAVGARPAVGGTAAAAGAGAAAAGAGATAAAAGAATKAAETASAGATAAVAGAGATAAVAGAGATAAAAGAATTAAATPSAGATAAAAGAGATAAAAGAATKAAATPSAGATDAAAGAGATAAAAGAATKAAATASAGATAAVAGAGAATGGAGATAELTASAGATAAADSATTSGAVSALAAPGSVPDVEPPPLALEAPPLQAFLEQISLVGDADGDSGVGVGRVSLMTLHAAKGLEFDAVFLTGMEEEVFPHRRATGPEAAEEDMSEERRLCYVGFTRARRRLFCSCAQARALFGELRFNAPSRFLSEVPRELFGFDDNTTVTMDPVHARPPTVRRRYEDDATGPVVDHSYDQSGEFGDDGDGDVRGRKVVHSQFGRGVILDVNGKGPTAKLTVRFDSVGVKLVIARFLQPL